MTDTQFPATEQNQSLAPTLERHNGRWFMFLGDEASPMDAVIEHALNAKVARMTEADRAMRERRARALSDLAEMDGEMLP